MNIIEEKIHKIKTDKNNEMELYLRNYNNEKLSITLFSNNQIPSKKYELNCNLEELQKNRFFKIFINVEEIIKELNNKIKKSKFIEDSNCIIIVIQIGLFIINEIILVIDEKEKKNEEKINELLINKEKMEKIINNLTNENEKLSKNIQQLKTEHQIEIVKLKNKLKEKKLNEEKNNLKININNLEKNNMNEIFNSNIINEEDKKTLNNWFNLNNDKTFKLLYKASRDGDNYQDFYRLCENKRPTITIILTTKKFKFGGYTSLSWKNPNKEGKNFIYYEDKNAFIFSLNKKKKFYPKKNDKNHICMRNDRGPSFGVGHDLTLDNNCLNNDNSCNNCPNTFITERCELNGGEYNFVVEDYEVYSIK